MEDLNGDGDCLNANEKALRGNGLSHPVDLAFGPDGRLLATRYGSNGVMEFKDLNNDGDALESGEGIVYATMPSANNFGLASVQGLDILINNYSSGDIYLYRDLNGDGDALDMNETTAVASGLDWPRGMVVQDNRLYVADYNSGRISLLEDLNGDGDAFDAGENRVFADGFSSPSAVATPIPGTLVLILPGLGILLGINKKRRLNKKEESI